MKTRRWFLSFWLLIPSHELLEIVADNEGRKTWQWFIAWRFCDWGHLRRDFTMSSEKINDILWWKHIGVQHSVSTTWQVLWQQLRVGHSWAHLRIINLNNVLTHGFVTTTKGNLSKTPKQNRTLWEEKGDKVRYATSGMENLQLLNVYT